MVKEEWNLCDEARVAFQELCGRLTRSEDKLRLLQESFSHAVATELATQTEALEAAREETGREMRRAKQIKRDAQKDIDSLTKELDRVEGLASVLDEERKELLAKVEARQHIMFVIPRDYSAEEAARAQGYIDGLRDSRRKKEEKLA